MNPKAEFFRYSDEKQQANEVSFSLSILSSLCVFFTSQILSISFPLYVFINYLRCYSHKPEKWTMIWYVHQNG